MEDSHARGKNTDIFVCLLRPLDETIAFLVPLVFKRQILTLGVGAAMKVHIDRMIHNEVDRQAGIDLPWIASKLLYGVTHRREIDQKRNARYVRHQNSHRVICDLPLYRRIAGPKTQAANIFLTDAWLIAIPQ